MAIKNFIKIFLVIDVIVIVICIIFDNYIWFINSQVASVSSLITMIGSFFGYKKNVVQSIGNIDIKNSTGESKENIFKEIEEKECDLLEIEEKSKMHRSSLKNMFSTIFSFISIYRVLGYCCIVFGFFALNNNNLLHLYSYFIGLFIVTCSLLLSLLLTKDT